MISNEYEKQFVYTSSSSLAITLHLTQLNVNVYKFIISKVSFVKLYKLLVSWEKSFEIQSDSDLAPLFHLIALQ